MCFCEEKLSYQPFYDGKYFSDGELCNGIVFFSDDNIYYQAVTPNGELHERGDEEPVLLEPDFTEFETKSPESEKWVCENCNAYKPAEIKKYGEIYACRNCRRKLAESQSKKAQLSLFWEQGRLF